MLIFLPSLIYLFHFFMFLTDWFHFYMRVEISDRKIDELNLLIIVRLDKLFHVLSRVSEKKNSVI